MSERPLDEIPRIRDNSETYLQALSLISPLFEGRPDVPRYVIKRVGIRLLECCSGDEDVMLGIVLLRQSQNSVAEHSLKVGIVIAAMVNYLSLPPGDRLDAVISGLLHHLGQDTTGALASSPGSQAQRSLMSLLLTQNGDKGHYRQVLTAFQHQLGYDGTGEPRLDFPVKQHPLAALLTVANDFVELTSESTGNRSAGPLLSVDALARMRKRAGSRYHPALLTVLERVVGPCPVGSFLRLKDGRTVVVTRFQSSDTNWEARAVEVGSPEHKVTFTTDNLQSLVEGIVDSRPALARVAG